MNNTPIPKYFHLFFKWFCHPDIYEEIAGDLEETFHSNLNKRGASYARQQYRKEVLLLLRPSVIKTIQFTFLQQISTVMFQNYFKIAFRNGKRDKVSALINILGLSIGFASSLLIILFVSYELNMDTSFEKGERVYRITNDERSFRETGRYLATTGPPFAPTLVSEYPEVESAVRLRYTDDVVFKHENQQTYRGLHSVYCLSVSWLPVIICYHRLV